MFTKYYQSLYHTCHTVSVEIFSYNTYVMHWYFTFLQVSKRDPEEYI